MEAKAGPLQALDPHGCAGSLRRNIARPVLRISPKSKPQIACCRAYEHSQEPQLLPTEGSPRRAVLCGSLALLAGTSGSPPPAHSAPQPQFENGPYCDYTQTLPCEAEPGYTVTDSGLLYRDLRFGEGEAPRQGENVTVDWDGYTFYLQHVVQARNLAKGGDFTADESAFLRFAPGLGQVIPAFEECVMGMRVGGIRRIIVRPGPLSYPGVLSPKGGSWKEVGPEPASLSGRRALEFVLRNTANVDKSLLFDVELLAVGDRQQQLRRGPGQWAEDIKGKLS